MGLGFRFGFGFGSVAQGSGRVRVRDVGHRALARGVEERVLHVRAVVHLVELHRGVLHVQAVEEVLCLAAERARRLAEDDDLSRPVWRGGSVRGAGGSGEGGARDGVRVCAVGAGAARVAARAAPGTAAKAAVVRPCRRRRRT